MDKDITGYRTVKELIDELARYNPDAKVFVMVNNKDYEFTVGWGYSEGVTTQTAEIVSFDVEGMNKID